MLELGFPQCIGLALGLGARGAQHIAHIADKRTGQDYNGRPGNKPNVDCKVMERFDKK
jgi:hypothetical protein